MEEDLSVGLQLDTKDYESSINDALQKFNTFQKTLNHTKIGLNINQTKELQKVFTDIRSTALTELNKVQKRIDALTGKGQKIDIDYNTNIEKLKALQQEVEVTWNRNSRAKLENEIENVKTKLTSLEGTMEINEDDLTAAKTEYENLLKELQSDPLKIKYDSPSLIKYNTEINNIKDNLKRTGEEFDKTEKKSKNFGLSILNTVSSSSGRLNLMGRVMSQMRNSIALAINPLNFFRKNWNEIIMSDTSAFGNTFRNIGQNITNFLTPAFQKLAQWIINCLGYLNIFLKALTGGKLDLFAKTAKSSASIAKSTGTAARNTKEIAKNLAGFDELNNINQDTGGSGGSGGGAGGVGDVGTIEPQLDPKIAKVFEDIGNAINKAFDWLVNKGGWKIVVAALGAVLLGLLAFNLFTKSKTFETIGSGFSSMLKSIGKGVEALAILGGFALVIHELTGFMEEFNKSGLEWYEAVGLIAGILGVLSLAVIGVMGAMELFSPTLTDIAAAAVIFAGIAVILLSLSEVIKSITAATKAGVDIGKALTAVVASIVVLIAALTAAAIILGSNPLALIAVVALALSLSAILLVVAETLPTILDAVGKFINTVAPSLIKILETIFNGVTKIILALGTTLPPIINSIGNLFNTIFKGVDTVISTVGQTVVNIMNTAKNLVTTVLKAILDFINKLGPAINNFVSNVIVAVTRLVNFLVSAIEYMVQLVIDGVNGIIKAINKVGDKVGFTIPKVPDFKIRRFVPSYDVGANYIPNDQLAMVHKGEAIIPAKFNDEKFFGNNEETNNLLRQLIVTLEDKDFDVNIDGNAIGKTATNYINKKSRIMGRSVI